jgi:non-heme chloroperoxidase
MPTITADDGMRIFFKDWGPVEGRPVLLSHGWPLNSDAWESQALYLAEHGCRVIAHDRRGHGRSSQSWNGNDMDTYADDLATLLDTLDLTGVTLVGHSTGGGEVVRYTARHGCSRVAKLVLVSAVPPIMVRTDDNPEGLPIEVFDAIRAGERASRSQLYRDLADGPFFGHNRRGDIPQGVRDAFWSQGLASGHRGAYECIAAFSATDFRGDLAEITVPTLVIHGDDDQIVPIEVGGLRSAKLIDGAELTVYAGAGHALPDTEKQRLSQDLLDFIQS